MMDDPGLQMITDLDDFILPEESGESTMNYDDTNHEVDKTNRKVDFSLTSDDHGNSIDLADHEHREESTITPVEDWMNTEIIRHQRHHESFSRREDLQEISSKYGIIPADNNSPPLLVEVVSVPFLRHRIKVFSKPAGLHLLVNRYFYEPIVQLDLESVHSRENFIFFKIVMWNEDIESKVGDCVKDLPGCYAGMPGAIHVQVMDYKEVELVLKDNSSSNFRLPEHPIVSYHQMDKCLVFCLVCDTQEEAVKLVAQIRSNPSILTQQLSLECRMVASPKIQTEQYSSTFDLRLPSEDHLVLSPERKDRRRAHFSIFFSFLKAMCFVFVVLMAITLYFTLPQQIKSMNTQFNYLENETRLFLRDFNEFRVIFDEFAKSKDFSHTNNQNNPLYQADWASSATTSRKHKSGNSQRDIAMPNYSQVENHQSELVFNDGILLYFVIAIGVIMYSILRKRITHSAFLFQSIRSELDDVKEEMRTLRMMTLRTTSKLAVPVFTAMRSMTTQIPVGRYVTFTKLESSSLELHGVFNLKTGIYTVHTDGIYHFFFSGLSSDGSSDPTHVELRVNGEKKESAYSNLNCSFGHHSVVLFALFPLKKGDEVGIFLISGNVLESPRLFTLFSGVLFIDK